jgi:hypothetical protein
VVVVVRPRGKWARGRGVGYFFCGCCKGGKHFTYELLEEGLCYASARTGKEEHQFDVQAAGCLFSRSGRKEREKNRRGEWREKVCFMSTSLGRVGKEETAWEKEALIRIMVILFTLPSLLRGGLTRCALRLVPIALDPFQSRCSPLALRPSSQQALISFLLIDLTTRFRPWFRRGPLSGRTLGRFTRSDPHVLTVLFPFDPLAY